MVEDNETVEEQEVEEELEEATFQEQQEEPEAVPEPEEAPAPAMLAQEKVKELVQATNLPEAAKTKLLEAEYADEDEAQVAIEAEVAYIKEVTGSGKPFAQGAGESPPEQTARTVEESDADFERILGEIGMPHLVGG